MRFHKHIYLTEYMKTHLKQAEKVIKKVRKKDLINDAYVLSLKSSGGLFDIIYAPMLSKKYYPTEDIYIVGIAEDEEAAALLAADIVMDTYEKRGDFKVYDFFSERS